MKRIQSFTWVFLLLGFIALMLTGCSNAQSVATCLKGEPYGFWSGLWHGIIAPIDLIAMIWRSDVAVFAQNNNGFWYSFGFIIGSGGWGVLGGNRMSRRKRHD